MYNYISLKFSTKKKTLNQTIFNALNLLMNLEILKNSLKLKYKIN